MDPLVSLFKPVLLKETEFFLAFSVVLSDAPSGRLASDVSFARLLLNMDVINFVA